MVGLGLGRPEVEFGGPLRGLRRDPSKTPEQRSIDGEPDDGPEKSGRRSAPEDRVVGLVPEPVARSLKNDGRSDVVCKRVKPVGSNIPQTVCRSRSQMKDQQYAAQNLADELRQLQSLEDCPPNIPIC